MCLSFTKPTHTHTRRHARTHAHTHKYNNIIMIHINTSKKQDGQKNSSLADSSHGDSIPVYQTIEMLKLRLNFLTRVVKLKRDNN